MVGTHTHKQPNHKQPKSLNVPRDFTLIPSEGDFDFVAKSEEKRNQILFQILDKLPSNAVNEHHRDIIMTATNERILDIDHRSGTMFKVKWIKGTERTLTTIAIFDDHIECPSTPIIKFKKLRQIRINEAMKKSAFTLIQTAKEVGVWNALHFTARNEEKRNQILQEIFSKLPSNAVNQDNWNTVITATEERVLDIDHNRKNKVSAGTPPVAEAMVHEDISRTQPENIEEEDVSADTLEQEEVSRSQAENSEDDVMTPSRARIVRKVSVDAVVHDAVRRTPPKHIEGQLKIRQDAQRLREDALRFADVLRDFLKGEVSSRLTSATKSANARKRSRNQSRATRRADAAISGELQGLHQIVRDLKSATVSHSLRHTVSDLKFTLEDMMDPFEVDTQKDAEYLTVGVEDPARKLLATVSSDPVRIQIN